MHACIQLPDAEKVLLDHHANACMQNIYSCSVYIYENLLYRYTCMHGPLYAIHDDLL